MTEGTGAVAAAAAAAVFHSSLLRNHFFSHFKKEKKNLNNGLENVVMEVGDWLECYWNNSGKI